MNADQELLHMNDQLQRRVIELTDHREGLVAQLAKQERRIGQLQAELTKQMGEDPSSADARKAFDHWVTMLGKNKRTTFGPARQKAVLARLGERALTEEGTRLDDVLWAINGLSVKRYVGPHGRQATDGPGCEKHDDLRIVCQDETNIERFMGYADAALAEAAGEKEDTGRDEQLKAKARKTLITENGRNLDEPDKAKLYPDGYRAVLEALARLDLRTTQPGRDSGQLMAQCPAHEDRTPSLSIKEKGDGTILLHCFAGCENAQVLEALDLSWGDLGGPQTLLDHERQQRLS